MMWYSGRMEILNYTAKVHAAEEGGFWVEVPALPGCFTQGETLDEAIAMTKDAINGYLASLVERGQGIPIERHEDLVGTLDVQVRAPACV